MASGFGLRDETICHCFSHHGMTKHGMKNMECFSLSHFADVNIPGTKALRAVKG